MFKRLFSSEVEDFASSLALEFSTRFPPDNPQGTKSLGLAKAVDEICNRAAEFQRSKNLGVYGKAKLGTAFKLQLKEAGYPDEFINELTQRLLIKISGPR